MDTRVYVEGVLREWWNDTTRTYTEYDEQGVEVSSRPYTEEENDRADADLALVELQAAEEARQVASRALLEASIALTEEAHEEGQAWSQPTGVHNAYPVGTTVVHNGKTWTSLTPFNVWEPGVSGWREEVSEGYPEWVQPTGGHDAYGIGDRVTFEGAVYESSIAANTWSPTAYPAGWTLIP